MKALFTMLAGYVIYTVSEHVVNPVWLATSTEVFGSLLLIVGAVWLLAELAIGIMDLVWQVQRMAKQVDELYGDHRLKVIKADIEKRWNTIDHDRASVEARIERLAEQEAGRDH